MAIALRKKHIRRMGSDEESRVVLKKAITKHS